jgi:hypothetical protein
VREVLLDEQGHPCYLEVELADDDRTVLVPVGYAARDPDVEEIWISSLRREDYRSVPSLERDRLRAEDEDRLARAYERAHSGDRYYESPHFRSRDLGPERRAGRDVPERLGRAAETAGTRRDETAEAPARLDSLDDIQVAEDDPDPRGWTVLDREGERLGRVDHLLGDIRSMKVRYFVVELDRELTDGSDRMLVPAGHASLDRDHDQVVVRAVDRDRIGGAPGWSGSRLDREHERRVVGWFDQGYRGDDRYHHPRYRLDRLARR